MSRCLCPLCCATPAPTYTEAHRHACEVRYLAALPSREARREYLTGERGVDTVRGIEAGKRLRDGLREMGGER